MPIVRFTNNPAEIPFFAENVKVDTTCHGDGKRFGPYALWTYELFNGFCLFEREANSYHDSDFFMLVWNPFTGVPEEICFASTRGWTYPAMASRRDATPEVMAAYEAYRSARDRRARICGAWARRNKKVAIARAIGETNYRNLRKLEAVVPGGKWAQTIDLLTNPRIRSAFRKSLRDQILAWYRNPSPKYETPLSRKQWEYV